MFMIAIAEESNLFCFCRQAYWVPARQPNGLRICKESKKEMELIWDSFEIHSNDQSINEWNACVCFSRIRSEGYILYCNDIRVICALQDNSENGLNVFVNKLIYHSGN